MKVSIVTMTYNHSRYAEEALDGVLAQDCDFDYELLIGDDASTDGTRDIVQRYATRFPDRVGAILRDENLGAWRNLTDLLERCRGQYSLRVASA